MGLLDRFRAWRYRRITVKLTLGAVPLPALIPDAEDNLREIYAIHKGFKVVRYWEVLILKADRDEFTVQFFPIAPDPEACLAVGVKGRKIVRFVPILGNMRELQEVNEALGKGKTFEMTFETDPGMMTQEGLISIGVIDPAKAVDL